MKKIYFVRHGESEGNASLIKQSPETRLSERGRAQARAIAERCGRLDFDIVISSPYDRAQETAEIITKKTEKPLQLSELFIERRSAVAHRGKRHDDPEVVATYKAIKENFHIDDFRLADEENFKDLKNRAEKALEFLKNRKEENILVVSHGFFLRMIVAYAFFGEKLTGYECRQLAWKLGTENTGITILEFNDQDSDPFWKLRTWNDYAHLG